MNQQFTQDHHNIYNALKNTLAGFAHQGVPGMQAIHGMVDKMHQQLGGQKQGTGGPTAPQPQPQAQTQQPVRPQGTLARTNPGLIQDINALQGQPVVATPSPGQGSSAPSPWLVQFLRMLQGGSGQR